MKDIATKIQLKNISKTFRLGNNSFNDVKVVYNTNLSIKEGEFVIICGPSGSGKSTMLNMLIGLEKPTTGNVYHDDFDIYELNQDKRAKLRLSKIGVVFQQSIWLKNLPVLENVAMPFFFSGHGYKESLNKAMTALQSVNMDSFAKRLPSELSGGQQQKIAVARALLNDPEVLIADEPTGNLDTESSNEVMKEFLNLNDKYKKTIVMVTHNLAYLKLSDKNYYVKDGRLYPLDFKNKKVPDSISEIEKIISKRVGVPVDVKGLEK